MSLATSNRDGGRTNEAGHLRGVTKGFLGRVLSGLDVSQRGAGANMSVDVAIGDAIIQRSDGTYGHPAWNDAVYNQAIAAADGSNPRRDIIVMYIDYGETPSTGVANNTNGVVKITSVSGTAAGSPVDPSSATIQSAVGSGNPWIKLARVRVAAGATSISNSVIDDLRELATGMSQGGWIYDSVFTWVYASSTTFTIAGVDVTAQFPVGTKLALYQSGTLKYFTVTSSVFSTNTTVTVDGGSTTLTNVPIDKPAFSYDYAPAGFPTVNLPDQVMGYKKILQVGNSAQSSLDTGTFAAYKRLRLIIRFAPSSSLSPTLRFNNDSGNNYSHSHSLDMGAATSAFSQSAWVFTGSTGVANWFFTTEIFNEPTSLIKSMHMMGMSGVAGANPNIRFAVGTWNNTSVPITRVTLLASTGNLGTASIIVLGAN